MKLIFKFGESVMLKIVMLNRKWRFMSTKMNFGIYVKWQKRQKGFYVDNGAPSGLGKGIGSVITALEVVEVPAVVLNIFCI